MDERRGLLYSLRRDPSNRSSHTSRTHERSLATRTPSSWTEQDRAAAARVLSNVSLDAFSRFLECLEGPKGTGKTPGTLTTDEPPGVEPHVQDLAEKVILLMADVVSPKEVNLLALEHAQDRSTPR